MCCGCLKERERGQERCWCMSSQMEKERFGDSIVTSFLTPQVTAFSSRQVCVCDCKVNKFAHCQQRLLIRCVVTESLLRKNKYCFQWYWSPSSTGRNFKGISQFYLKQNHILELAYLEHFCQFQKPYFVYRREQGWIGFGPKLLETSPEGWLLWFIDLTERKMHPMTLPTFCPAWNKSSVTQISSRDWLLNWSPQPHPIHEILKTMPNWIIKSLEKHSILSLLKKVMSEAKV